MKTILLASTILALATGANAADYGYYAAPPPPVVHYHQHQHTTVVAPPAYYAPPRRHREWNPIGAIMAVPRAALAVPGAILGGDDYYDEE